VRSRAERYVGASRIFDIDDRVKIRNDLCRDMGAFVNRAGVSPRILSHSGHEGRWPEQLRPRRTEATID
jgi:hypothetical protein